MTATVKVMSPEEIAARSGGETPFLQPPDARTLFAERAMRARQLAAGHAMGDFLRFVAALSMAQHEALQRFPSVPLPDAAALDRAAAAGQPPLPAADWPRDAAWRDVARRLARDAQDAAPQPLRAALAGLAEAGDETLERQADALLTGVMEGLDLSTSAVVAAALQVYWTHMAAALQRLQAGGTAPFGRVDDPAACPCCGSRPVASLTRLTGELSGQRYLHCSLCAMQWHLPRIRCVHCGAEQHVAYQSLASAAADADDEAARTRAAQAAVQAECCDDCGHYLKILHAERDPQLEPVADDLATLTLDLLVSDAGMRRHGVNLMLLFGAPEPPAAAGAPPDPEDG